MLRGPPKKSRREKFIDRMLYYAENDKHGYSQKPPSGRWGPDFDCSSLIYQAASDAGYSVGTGGDKVRFTGTMLRDFKDAGFQVLPFANVGVSDLKLDLGDVLLNLALHAEVYVKPGETAGATGSETGGYVGEAGDQTGHEIEVHPVGTFDKEWNYILRPPDDKEDLEEGDEEVPMNYPMGNYGQPGQPQSTVPMGRNFNQQYPMGPQGNLGQMNGYSQASAGGYGQPSAQPNMQTMPMGPQGGGNRGITEDSYVMGIEGANQHRGNPGVWEALFDEDMSMMYLTNYGPQGMPQEIVPYKLVPCAEEMPQHLSPIMRHTNPSMTMGGGMNNGGDYISRKEVEEMLREMLPNVQSNDASDANGSRPGSQSANARAGRSS